MILPCSFMIHVSMYFSFLFSRPTFLCITDWFTLQVSVEAIWFGQADFCWHRYFCNYVVSLNSCRIHNRHPCLQIVLGKFLWNERWNECWSWSFSFYLYFFVFWKGEGFYGWIRPCNFSVLRLYALKIWLMLAYASNFSSPSFYVPAIPISSICHGVCA